jgi:hypothetical protein
MGVFGYLASGLNGTQLSTTVISSSILRFLMPVGGLNLRNAKIWSKEAEHDDKYDSSDRRPRFAGEGPGTQGIHQYLTAAEAEDLQLW